jgi:hypothetical protein
LVYIPVFICILDGGLDVDVFGILGCEAPQPSRVAIRLFLRESILSTVWTVVVASYAAGVEWKQCIDESFLSNLIYEGKFL